VFYLIYSNISFSLSSLLPCLINFKVSSIDVVFNDDDGEVEDLYVGDLISIRVDEDDEVIYISAERNLDLDMLSAHLVDIYEDDNQIVVKQDTKYNIYILHEDVRVLLNNEEVDIDDLEEDDELRIKLDDNKVVEVRAYRILVED